MLYEFQCTACSKVFELLLPLYLRNGPAACPHCFPVHVECKRILSPTPGKVVNPAAGEAR